MTRVDLDAIEEMAATYNSILLRLNVPALVAELRAAREVIDAARWIERTGALPPSDAVGARRLSDLEQAVRAYDEAVGE